MSYSLNTERSSVAFAMDTGEPIQERPDDFDCVLDIYSNLTLDLGPVGLGEFGHQGNYSGWMALSDNEGVAVSGLTSCGAVLVANANFSFVAAGHMSGDARFVGPWCEALAADARGIRPHHMLWGTGPDGSRRTGGQMLMQYMKAFNINPARAPAVVGCGAIFLVRSGSGKAFASVSVEMPFRRQGQAVRQRATSTSLDPVLALFLNLQDFDQNADLTHYTMLITTLGAHVGVHAPLQFEESKQRKQILELGPVIMKKFAPSLEAQPEFVRTGFRKFNLFTAFPTLKV